MTLNGEGNDNPLQYSCLDNPVDRGAWWAAVCRVAQSQTRLMQLSMRACTRERNGNPLQYSCLENPRDRGAWWVSIYGVAQSRARLKQLSSSGNDPKINLGLLTGIWAVRGNWLGNEGSKNCDLSLRFTRTYKQIRH